MMAIGDRSLELAGRVADGVVLHTFLTDETLARSVGVVRKAAADAGRDPADVRVWAVLATVHDGLPEEAPAAQAGRPAGDVPAGLRRRARLAPTAGTPPPSQRLPRRTRWSRATRAPSTPIGTVEELTTLRERAIPADWLAASASGSAPDCAARVLDQLEAGADSVILHGATPAELAPVVEAYAAIRPAGRFDHLPANPGWSR